MGMLCRNPPAYASCRQELRLEVLVVGTTTAPRTQALRYSEQLPSYWGAPHKLGLATLLFAQSA